MGATMHEDRFGIVTSALDVAEVAANTTAEQDFTVEGLKTGMFVAVNKPSLSAGLGIVNARVSAVDTLSITFVNATAVAIDPASETYVVLWYRPERTDTRVNP